MLIRTHCGKGMHINPLRFRSNLFETETWGKLNFSLFDSIRCWRGFTVRCLSFFASFIVKLCCLQLIAYRSHCSDSVAGWPNNSLAFSLYSFTVFVACVCVRLNLPTKFNRKLYELSKGDYYKNDLFWLVPGQNTMSRSSSIYFFWE
jgi:hypothetical protein